MFAFAFAFRIHVPLPHLRLRPHSGPRPSTKTLQPRTTDAPFAGRSSRAPCKFVLRRWCPGGGTPYAQNPVLDATELGPIPAVPRPRWSPGCAFRSILPCLSSEPPRCVVGVRPSQASSRGQGSCTAGRACQRGTHPFLFFLHMMRCVSSGVIRAVSRGRGWGW
ncbi:hypothetical protein C8Q77DRAFT_1077271 [Trametes polyzona]|nr:hypothetical protein C8Q77DRAFT_1077271 [Trametes polyzona]